MKMTNNAEVTFTMEMILLGKYCIKRHRKPFIILFSLQTGTISALRQIYTLFKKDLLLEVRQQYSFYGILLYVGATIFVLYMALESPETRVWNGLFWVIQLFICINAVAKSFLQETKARMLYYYSIASPRDFVIAKLLFNSLLMLVMSLLSLLLFYNVSWQSDSRSGSIYWPCIAWRLELKPRLYFFGRDSSKSPAKCRNHGGPWIPDHHPSTDIADAANQCCFCPFGYGTGHDSITTGCARPDGDLAGYYTFSFFMERLNSSI